MWPIVGDVLVNYSMDKTVYFPTLQQYKYNPAIVIAANKGDSITAAADLLFSYSCPVFYWFLRLWFPRSLPHCSLSLSRPLSMSAQFAHP